MSMNDRAFYKALGARIAQRREEIGLTQVEVAAMLHIAQPTYGAYEVGRSRFPASLLASLADVLKTDVAFVLGIAAKNASARRGSPRR